MSDISLPVLKEIKEQLIQHNLLLRKQNLLRKKILSLDEACDYLGIAKSYCYKLSSQNILPTHCPLGKKIFFLRTDLEKWCLQNRRAPDAQLDRQAIDYVTRKPFNRAI